MADRSDRPMSSDEMLEQARREIRDGGPAASGETAPESLPMRRVPPPSPNDASASSSRTRPPPPTRRREDPVDPAAQRRAVVLVAIAIALVVAGFVSAILFARAGI